jgi:two-component system, NarL family, nitrate/nitrite response regulator NarL
MSIRVVIADDHPLVVQGLDSVFASEPDINVVARCNDGLSALAALEKHRPDVLVLDLRMPRLDGLGVIRAVRERSLATRIVVLTAALDDDEVLASIRLGVAGIVLKEMAPQMLVQCLRTVHAGRRWLEQRTVARALEQANDRETSNLHTAESLTPRETDIVRLVARGRRNKEIAREFGITEGTVKLHIHNIYAKLGVDNRVSLAAYARNCNLI